MQAQIHNKYLSAIKRLLGASFVGWEQDKNKKQLKIIINKQTVLLPFESDKVITEDSYKDLIQQLMETERFENLYNYMVQRDELNDFLPKASGDWEKDKKRFIALQREMESMANLSDVDLS